MIKTVMEILISTRCNVPRRLAIRVPCPVELPAFLPGEPLVEKGEHLRHVELNILQVQLFLIVLLHLQEIVKLKIEFQKPSIAS